MVRAGVIFILLLALGVGFAAGLLGAPHLPQAQPSTARTDPLSLEPAAEPPPAVVEAPAVHPALDPLAILLDPSELPRNLAHFSEGARATGGFRPECLIDGESIEYDDNAGFAQTHWTVKPNQAFTITLRDTIPLNVVRLLLWSRDDRFYRYRLEASADVEGKNWTLLADKTDEETECRGWQVIGFPSQSVRHIRLTGTFNSVNDYFHVVELQAFRVSGQPEAEEGEPEF